MATAAIAGVQLLGAYGQAQALEAQGEYQNEMMKINSRNADRQGARAIDLGEKAAQEYKKKVNQVVGSQRAGYASQGVQVDSGTAQAIQLETMDIGVQDVEQIRTNAFLEAMGYKSESQDLIRKGRMARMGAQTEARNTLLSGGLQAAATVYNAK